MSAVVLAAACIALLAPCPGAGPRAAATAPPALRVMNAEPIAVRGGVLLVPVAAAVDAWPDRVVLRFEDGTTVEGSLICIGVSDPAPVARSAWTRPLVALSARAPDVADAATGVAHVAARLPTNGRGAIELGGRMLRPIWVDRPPVSPDRTRLPRGRRPDLPDPDIPSAHWRWALLADADGLAPPDPGDFAPAAALLAEHQADLWRVGLARLAAADPGLAGECLDALTRRCHDLGQPVAAWIADPEALTTLLETLLDGTRPARTLASRVRAWLDARPRLLAWPESAPGDTVRLAVINRGADPVRLVARWEDAPGAAESTHALPAGQLTRIAVPRAPLPPAPAPGLPAPPEPLLQALRLETGGEICRLTIGRRTTFVRPPAAFLPPARPPYTLAEIETQSPRPAPAAWTTQAQVRRLRGRWELFVECRREPDGPTGTAGSLDGTLDWRQLRGREAITLLVGPEDDPSVVLAVPEQGWHQLLSGLNDGTLQIHRRSYADRWYCRIVLPNTWLGAGAYGAETPVRVGLVRTFSAGDGAHTTPDASAPWRQEPGRAALRLDAWDD